MTCKEVIEMENNETDKRTHKTHHYTRMFCIVMLYPISLFVIGLIPDTGEKNEALSALLMAIFSSLIVILLIPVIFRGSIAEKTVAIIISLPALWFGYFGWHDTISHFVGYRTLGL
jgi:uncharacterized membrane protein YjjP (DUF1212 family)